MREAYKLTTIEFADLSLMALEMRGNGARLSQICSVRTKTGFDLLYSFVKDYEFINYKVSIEEDTEIESISSILPLSSSRQFARITGMLNLLEIESAIAATFCALGVTELSTTTKGLPRFFSC